TGCGSHRETALAADTGRVAHGFVGMDSTLSLAQLPLIVCLAVAVTAGLIAAMGYLHRQRVAADLALRAAAAPGKIIYNDAPTVKVSDSQRVDRRRKIVRLAAGEHIDILETPEGLDARFRITLKSVVRMADSAHLAIAFGGTRVSCGPLVKVKALDAEAGTAELDVMQVSAHWPKVE